MFQVSHLSPLSHLSHLGIVKSNTAADEVHELATDAEVQASPVVVLHTVIVAALPVSHLSPLSPLGIVKSNTAALEVQLFTTLAEVQA